MILSQVSSVDLIQKREPGKTASTDSEDSKNDEITDDGCWDNETKISSVDENVNKIHMSIGNHISNVNDVSDDVIEIIDTVEPEKANDSTNNIEIDYTERMDTVISTEPMNEVKEKQFSITENLDNDPKNSKGCVLKKTNGKTV